MTIGERITYLRTKKGLPQSRLAQVCKIPQSTLHGYESGARSSEGMAVSTAKKLAEALGVSLDYLCGVYEGELTRPAMADTLEGTAAIAVEAVADAALRMSVSNA